MGQSPWWQPTLPSDLPATGVVTVGGRTTTLENLAGAAPRTSGCALPLFGVNFESVAPPTPRRFHGHLLRRRHTLTLRRVRLDLDALATDRGTQILGQIAGRITLLVAGASAGRVFPGDGEPDSHGECARKISRYVKLVLHKGPGEVIAAEMRPGPRLRAAEGYGAVGTDEGAAAGDGRVGAERRGLRHAGGHGRGHGDFPGTFQLLRLRQPCPLQHVENSALLTGLGSRRFLTRLRA